MSLALTLRSRLVMALAVCAVLWSDPAVAELICAATPGCPHHAAQARISSPANAIPSISGVKPCCPLHRAPLGAPADTTACCAFGNTRAVLPVASSGNSGSKQALAHVASSLFACAATDPSLLFNSEITISYVKPVNQKKTDLRI